MLSSMMIWWMRSRGDVQPGRLATRLMLMMIEECIVCWNVRGAGSKEFMREMKEIMKAHRPMVVILLEPRISGAAADVVRKEMGKGRWIRSEAVGFSGRIWVPWNENEISLKLRYSDRFFLHLEVKSRGGREGDYSCVCEP